MMVSNEKFCMQSRRKNLQHPFTDFLFLGDIAIGFDERKTIKQEKGKLNKFQHGPKTTGLKEN